MKIKKYNYSGIVLFEFNDDINTWIVRKIYVGKKPMTSKELLFAQTDILNQKQRIQRLSNRFVDGAFETEKFTSKSDFKKLLKHYLQPKNVIDNYIKRIDKIVSKRGN